jgi:hypothetical protein
MNTIKLLDQIRILLGGAPLTGKLNQIGLLKNIRDLIANGALNGGSLAFYEATFSQSNLVNGVYTANHELNKMPVLAIVFDSSNEEIEPDRISSIDSNNISIDLNSYLPLIGNFKLKIYG